MSALTRGRTLMSAADKSAVGEIRRLICVRHSIRSTCRRGPVASGRHTGSRYRSGVYTHGTNGAVLFHRQRADRVAGTLLAGARSPNLTSNWGSAAPPPLCPRTRPEQQPTRAHYCPARNRVIGVFHATPVWGFTTV